MVGWLVGYGDDIFDCIEDVVGWEELSITAVVSFGLLIIPNTHKPPTRNDPITLPIITACCQVPNPLLEETWYWVCVYGKCK